MKMSADNIGSVRYFTAKLGRREHFDSREIEMLTAGAVPMLISPVAVQGRRNNIIRYDISPYSKLEYYLTCILSREQFADVLLRCIEVFKKMQQVYLNFKNLILDLDKVYVLLGDKTIHFIYLPIVNSNRETSIQSFFRNIIQTASTNRSTNEQIEFINNCIKWLDKPEPFMIDEFDSFIRHKIGLASKQDPPSEPLPNPGSVGTFPHLEYPVDSFAANRSGTIIIAESVAPKTRYYLMRELTKEQIEINVFPFLVGRDPKVVSYCIMENGAISNKHAQLSFQNGNCYITDQKSTNKTYVNDKQLTPFVAQKLENGDRIKLANELFEFVRED